MLSWLKQLDELLRGDRTRAEALSRGQLNLPLHVFVPAAVVLGGIYGFFMGWFALLGNQPERYQHALAVTAKLPALFLLTLGVTFPSLYVFNALVGARLSFAATLRLLIAAIVVNLAVGASLGPILGFFTVSTTSYPFMVLLNVALLGVAGVIGLGFLLKTLRALARASVGELPPLPEPPPLEADDAAIAQHRAKVIAARAVYDARLRQDSAANFIFQIWIVIYAVVGAQMSWVLRPFIGTPGSPLTIFRDREGNFFSAVVGALRGALGL